MLKSHWKLISTLERLGDNLLIIGAFLLSYYFRTDVVELLHAIGLSVASELRELAPIKDYFILLGVAIPVYNAALSMLGAYRSMRLSSTLKIVRMGVAGGVIVFLATSAILYLLKLDLSRSFVILFCVLSAAAVIAQRLIVLRVLRILRAQGRNFRNILIVGVGPQAVQLSREIANQADLGLRVVGFAATGDLDTADLSALKGRIVANRDTFELALKRYAVDEVLFTEILSNFAVVNELAQIAIEEGVRVSLAADIFSLEIFRSDMSTFGGIPLLHYEPSRGAADSPAHLVKRLIDVVVSAVGLILLSPLLLVLAVAIKLTSPGPIFFRQKRVGLNGRKFTLYKFRSMVKDAVRMRADLEELNEMEGPVFKIKDDPRVTPLGRWMRRYSLDELPQLFNVVIGDMSLVGPRPPLPSEVSEYQRKHRRRLSMRPGLTCTWQVSGRNDIPDFNRWAELDLEYIDNWSLMGDLRLLVRTIPAVLSGNGAR